MADYLDQPRTRNTDNELVPRALVNFYVSGGAVRTPAFSAISARRDEAGAWMFDYGKPHPNPMQSDSAARLPPIFLDTTVTYRMVMTDEDGNVLHDIDPFVVFPGPELITPLTDDGQPMPFATLTTYLQQTTQVAEAELEADANGIFQSPLVLDEDTIYRVVLKDQFGQLIYDVDPYPGSGASIAPGGGGSTPPVDAPVINLTDHTLSALGAGDPGTLASCSVSLTNAGGMNLGTGFGTSGVYTVDAVSNSESVFIAEPEEWVTAASRVYLTETDAYAVRLTVLSGDPPDGSPIDEWLPIGGPFGGEASFLKTVQDGASFSAVWFLEIRDVATETLQASCTLTLSATSSP